MPSFNYYRYHFRSIRISVYLLISTLIFSCAQVVSPGGGPMDKTAPRVVKYSPDSAQMNFKSEIIEITFDEFVQLRDLNNQLIISPPLLKTPDISVKVKTLTIDLQKQELKPNTTYSIYFGNALQDMNENNPSENFRYIFSTGNFIDSLSVKGKVENAFDNKTEKGILVMLFSEMTDSAAYKGQPEYFTKTIADGSFEIRNVRHGNYKLLAIKDLNANYKYDGDAESIGFHNDTIDPSVKQTISVKLFQEPVKKMFVKKYFHTQYGKITLVFNRGSDSITVSNLTNDNKGVQEFTDLSKNKDTLTYWIKNYEKDSLKLQVSNGYTVIDTLEFKMIKKEEALKSKRNPLKLKLINNFNGNQNMELNSELKLVFSQPIASVNEKVSVELKEDTVLMKGLSFCHDTYYQREIVAICRWDSTSQAEDANNPGVFITAPFRYSNIGLKENTKYHFFIPPGTFTDIFGLTNDTIKIDFKTREEKYYGSLKLNLTLPLTKGNYIVQLMDEREKVIRENFTRESTILMYEYLHPQKYKLKIIYDDNINGKWDTGNYLQKVQAERVVYNKELIMIRSNWDADLEWKINE